MIATLVVISLSSVAMAGGSQPEKSGNALKKSSGSLAFYHDQSESQDLIPQRTRRQPRDSNRNDRCNIFFGLVGLVLLIIGIYRSSQTTAQQSQVYKNTFNASAFANNSTPPLTYVEPDVEDSGAFAGNVIMATWGAFIFCFALFRYCGACDGITAHQVANNATPTQGASVELVIARSGLIGARIAPPPQLFHGSEARGNAPQDSAGDAEVDEVAIRVQTSSPSEETAVDVDLGEPWAPPLPPSYASLQPTPNTRGEVAEIASSESLPSNNAVTLDHPGSSPEGGNNGEPLHPPYPPPSYSSLLPIAREESFDNDPPSNDSVTLTLQPSSPLETHGGSHSGESSSTYPSPPSYNA